MQFNDMPWSGRSFTTSLVGTEFNDMPWSLCNPNTMCQHHPTHPSSYIPAVYCFSSPDNKRRDMCTVECNDTSAITPQTVINIANLSTSRHSSSPSRQCAHGSYTGSALLNVNSSHGSPTIYRFPFFLIFPLEVNHQHNRS